MKVNCSVCGGKGQTPITFEGSMCYLGSNGESWPTEICNACGGSGIQEELFNETVHRIIIEHKNVLDALSIIDGD